MSGSRATEAGAMQLPHSTHGHAAATRKRKGDDPDDLPPSDDRMTRQDARQDADQMRDREVSTPAAAASHDTARKRVRLSFTDRAKSDVITLPLVFSFLDVYSLVASRRVCRTWSAASRRPLAWRHTRLAINIEWLCTLPLASIRMVRHICLVRDLKAPLPDLREVMQHLSGLPQLAELRLEELDLDANLCDLIATYLPTLQQFDCKMSSEHEDEAMKQHQAAAEEKARNDEEEEDDCSDAASTGDATAALEDAQTVSPYDAAMDFFGSSAGLPVLQLPGLTSLKLPYSRSLRHLLAFTSAAPHLRTLQVRRIATTSKSLDTARSESHYITVMNRRFRTTYADSMRHLSLMNQHHHLFSALDFHALHALTHLSLTQNSNFVAITRECLESISRLDQLVEVEIRVGNAALDACTELEWWLALSSIKSLASFAFWNPNGVVAFHDSAARTLFAGLQALTSAPHCRLHTVQLSNTHHIDDAVAELLTHAKHLHTISLYNANITLDALPLLATLPKLTSLEVIACRELHTSEGLTALIRNFPRLRALSFRLPSGSAQRHGHATPVISDDAWLQLPQLASLTSLHLSGYGLISQRVIDGWCQQALDGERDRQKIDEDSMRKFAGFDDPEGDRIAQSSTAVVATPAGSSSYPRIACGGVSWQELRCSGWMISLAQSRALLRALPQLQMLSVHLLETSAGSFTSPDQLNPRLLFAGGDYMQRCIASYIQDTHVFK